MKNFADRHSLKDKTVWITGGKRIGQEIAVSLAELGADLILSFRSSEKAARETVEKVRPLGRKVSVIQCDVSSRQSVSAAVKEIKKEFQKLDILILLASIFKPVKLKEIKEADWDDNFSVHVKGTFFPIQASLNLMPKGSHIITVADRTSIGATYRGCLPYVVTKAAITSMTKALAIELGPKGIFINSIAPGPILKPGSISQKEWQAIRRASIIKYPITDKEAVKEYVDTVIRLSLARSSGSIYPIDLGHL